MTDEHRGPWLNSDLLDNVRLCLSSGLINDQQITVRVRSLRVSVHCDWFASLSCLWAITQTSLTFSITCT
jgi:hypothetical protein